MTIVSDLRLFDSALALVMRATSFAAAKHSNPRRKDADCSPYINHPSALANLLVSEAKVEDPAVLCAALLHDTIEDTETTELELRSEFGDEIAQIVIEVTDDKSLDKAVRKQLQIEHAKHASHKAKLVKLADKICNLRDLVGSPPADWTVERKRDYFAWAEKVVDGLKGAHRSRTVVRDYF
ncbi:MAG: bifunctional (p)ppGpp synthetase/guanosine-3',5'-bis(diphosphate) 3'-pyrophosphohydrolase [Rhodocyclaceae bacterium]|nr:bifunctional (p)ppGpp synthetase/guanosine-3',5'-bis(diphosphate) 3'-pyrophosphohydrolase [Rhodocyclaceae bacterium]